MSALPTLRLRLPGQWWQIPLHDRDEARESIRRLVSRQLGSADVHAQAREDLRRHLLAALEQSIAGDGQSFHVALEIVPDIPVPVAISVAMPQQAITPAVGTSPAAVMEILERGLELAAPETWATAQRFESRGSSVLRLHRRQSVETLDTDGENPGKPVDGLAADYWMTVPGTKRFVLVACSTAFGPLEQIMLTFFDSIVRAAYWEPQPAPSLV